MDTTTYSCDVAYVWTITTALNGQNTHYPEGLLLSIHFQYILIQRASMKTVLRVLLLDKLLVYVEQRILVCFQAHGVCGELKHGKN